METPNESTDPLRPAYPDAPRGGIAEEHGQRDKGSRRNIALLVIVGIVVLLVIFFVGREQEPTADDAPLPTSVQ